MFSDSELRKIEESITHHRADIQKLHNEAAQVRKREEDAIRRVQSDTKRNLEMIERRIADTERNIQREEQNLQRRRTELEQEYNKNNKRT